MKQMPSPSVAERNQRRKLQYLPPIWPFAAVIVLVAAVVAVVRH